MEDPEIQQPTSYLRICRNPACMIAFDPKWRVKLAYEPMDAENHCPRCGMDLDLNPQLRRRSDGEIQRDYADGNAGE